MKLKKRISVQERMKKARIGKMRKQAIRKKLFIANFADMGGNIGQTCKLLKMARRTYYLWMQGDDKFKKKVDETEQSFVDNVESAAYATALEGSTTMQQFILKSKRRKVYGDRIEVDSTNKITLALNRFTDDELKDKIKEFE